MTGPGDELFGAVLGSGGNFGVVTSRELDLVPVTGVYGGQLVFDGPLVPRVLAEWRKWTATVPDSVTSTVTMLAFPDVPQLPGPLRGRFDPDRLRRRCPGRRSSRRTVAGHRYPAEG